ncbi:MAG TPA: GIY-YIG nuclease family protein [Chitinophagales bacterium]|nr:GIY-YIG nuclease family protein [Chitinophagales bacterium]
MKAYNFYVYLLTNYHKTVLYTGVTNDLVERIRDHYNGRGNPAYFTGRYHVFYLLYYEHFKYIDNAIAREKEIKGWTRAKKEKLIRTENPLFLFLNTDLFEKWPPEADNEL